VWGGGVRVACARQGEAQGQRAVCCLPCRAVPCRAFALWYFSCRQFMGRVFVEATPWACKIQSVCEIQSVCKIQSVFSPSANFAAAGYAWAVVV
jgi:hypothetical protein